MTSSLLHFWFRSRSSWHALTFSLSVVALAGIIFASQKQQLQTAFLLVHKARAQLAVNPLLGAGLALPIVKTNIETASWPLRMEVNEVVRHAGEIAEAQSVSVRTISISHQPVSVQAWGRVTLDVSASGRYAALKAWQSGMQKDFSSLSVQSLRLQGNSNSGSGDLDAQAILVLHVRD